MFDFLNSFFYAVVVCVCFVVYMLNIRLNRFVINHYMVCAACFYHHHPRCNVTITQFIWKVQQFANVTLRVFFHLFNIYNIFFCQFCLFFFCILKLNLYWFFNLFALVCFNWNLVVRLYLFFSSRSDSCFINYWKCA